MSVADKVQKLAALAGSANEHEANAAARQACRLIREGRVSLRDADQAGTLRPHQRRSPWESWQSAPAAQRRRPPPKGPFARRREVSGAVCSACAEPIEPGDACSSADGFVHGDCVPRGERP